jgi:FlaA1/EpsC-like NDP-sugar epimerase
MVKRLAKSDKVGWSLFFPATYFASSRGGWFNSDVARFLTFLAVDLAIVVASLAGAVAIAGQSIALPEAWLTLLSIIALCTLSAATFIRLGLYRMLLRHMGQHAVWNLVRAVSLVAVSFGLALYLFYNSVSAVVPLVFWLLMLVGIGGARMLIRTWYQSVSRANATRVIIYGAGESGQQLLHALNHGTAHDVVAFVDDDPRIHNSVINGRPVCSADYLEALVDELDVSQVLLAIPSASHERRREIINSLVGMTVHVRTVPKISELVAGRARVNQIQDVDLDDLLGRDPVPPHPELIDRCITGKVVMVTGAGGSIGSELCRQIIESSPAELILLEVSEYGLYQVERELRALCQKQDLRFPVITLLGNVRDQQRLETLFRTFKVDTVYHAAAYKHVPMVEHNVSEGVVNNVQGTWSAAQAAHKAGVDTFVLVSTDKAVRPTNVMGASKRFAELILQAMARTESQTRFCIVRFGNVLGSSGSVVPLFREQIESGGPVTVTHPEVSRYFMSIREAAQLVLQAGAMGTGGDVFVLDMGEPVRIVDLARRMIRLSGYELEGESLATDQIRVEFIGLRPGEKLHEELLLGTSVAGTGHPMIMRAEEDSLDVETLERGFNELMAACDQLDSSRVASILKDHVSGFEGHEPRHDFIWVKRGGESRRQPKPVEGENVMPFERATPAS